MSYRMRLLVGTLLVTALASQAMPAEQHRLVVVGHPQVFDVIPPTVPYVEVHSATWTSSVATLNGMYQMGGSCTQSTRMTREEAEAMVQAITLWLLDPAEEMVLWEKLIPTTPPLARARPSDLPADQARPATR
jgi:hypothetical protein